VGKAARLKAQRRQAATVEHAASDPATALEAAYPVKHQATHEAGHAVVSWSLGIPFDYVSLDTDPPGVWPLARTRQQLGDKWLIGAAGCIADYQARDLAILDADVLKLIFGSPDNRFSLTDRAGAAVVRPDRRPAVMTSGDLYLMATVMADCGDGQPWPASAVVDTWRGCERYVMACTPGITQVAAVLIASRRLTYAETSNIAAEAMTGMARPALPEWYESAQELSRRIEAEAFPSQIED
jgi:hypothetical protein